MPLGGEARDEARRRAEVKERVVRTNASLSAYTVRSPEVDHVLRQERRTLWEIQEEAKRPGLSRSLRRVHNSIVTAEASFSSSGGAAADGSSSPSARAAQSSSVTFFEFLDATSTRSGHRLLRQWLCDAGLPDRDDCGDAAQRGAAVQFLVDHGVVARRLREALKAADTDVDLEALTREVCAIAEGNDEFDDAAIRQLIALAEAFHKRLHVVATLALEPGCDGVVSHAKRAMVTGLLRELRGIVDDFEERPQTRSGQHAGFVPRAGCDQRYDEIVMEICGARQALEEAFDEIVKALPTISLKRVNEHEIYGNLTAMRAELRRPDGVGDQIEVLSEKSGRMCFQTRSQRTLLAKIEVLEDLLSQRANEFFREMLDRFVALERQLLAAARIVAELDALLALSLRVENVSGSEVMVVKSAAEMLQGAGRSSSGGTRAGATRTGDAAAAAALTQDPYMEELMQQSRTLVSLTLCDLTSGAGGDALADHRAKRLKPGDQVTICGTLSTQFEGRRGRCLRMAQPWERERGRWIVALAESDDGRRVASLHAGRHGSRAAVADDAAPAGRSLLEEGHVRQVAVLPRHLALVGVDAGAGPGRGSAERSVPFWFDAANGAMGNEH
eukprot:TRINITY_DN39250_c0_g1_i1.p1 TRINITY_DN39250_c0_g1~~TRINITY_DN39250_c0_g1_i1.p1  ORF type:complete len:615 (-),score=157.46 TRINITY_DN39250_c0_g1_i1:81-1925(-)